MKEKLKIKENEKNYLNESENYFELNLIKNLFKFELKNCFAFLLLCQKSCLQFLQFNFD